MLAVSVILEGVKSSNSKTCFLNTGKAIHPRTCISFGWSLKRCFFKASLNHLRKNSRLIGTSTTLIGKVLARGFFVANRAPFWLGEWYVLRQLHKAEVWVCRVGSQGGLGSAWDPRLDIYIYITLYNCIKLWSARMRWEACTSECSYSFHSGCESYVSCCTFCKGPKQLAEGPVFPVEPNKMFPKTDWLEMSSGNAKEPEISKWTIVQNRV